MRFLINICSKWLGFVSNSNSIIEKEKNIKKNYFLMFDCIVKNIKKIIKYN